MKARPERRINKGDLRAALQKVHTDARRRRALARVRWSQLVAAGKHTEADDLLRTHRADIEPYATRRLYSHTDAH